MQLQKCTSQCPHMTGNYSIELVGMMQRGKVEARLQKLMSRVQYSLFIHFMLFYLGHCIDRFGRKDAYDAVVHYHDVDRRYKRDISPIKSNKISNKKTAEDAAIQYSVRLFPT